MADFVQNSQIKNAVRVLASPIADVTAFNLSSSRSSPTTRLPV